VRSSAIFAVLTGVLVLSACQTPPPQAPKVTGPVLPLPPPAAAVPARPREPARWRFETGQESCTAWAFGRSARLRVMLQRGHPAAFTLSASVVKHVEQTKNPPGPGVEPPEMGAGALRFLGRDGGWTAPAKLGPGALAVTYLPLNATAVGRVALLLGGGSLDPIGAPARMPGLTLPVAGAAGRAWYACAQSLLR